MTDIVDAATRSRMMAAIGGKHTRPEMLVRRALYASGFRYRLHVKTLPGSPDIVLPKYNAVVHVHGCFWHRHEGCRYATTPATRPEFWEAKFTANEVRDERDHRLLAELGWRVAIVWECSLSRTRVEDTLAELVVWLRSGELVFQTEP